MLSPVDPTGGREAHREQFSVGNWLEGGFIFL